MGAETGPCAVRESKGEEVTMAAFPDGVRVFREKENLPGVVFDPNNKKTLYADDMIALEEEVRAVEATLLTPAGRRMPIVGTGFPNGVVTGSVGAKYIDTNATNGAIEWIKKSGTGNTGWVVSVGDTGWRNINSLVTGLTSGAIAVKRTPNRTEVSFDNAVFGTLTGNFTMFSHPEGFRPSRGGSYVILQGDGTIRTIMRTSGANLYSPQSGGVVSGTVSFDCVTAYPSTLPGTPA